MPIGCIGFRVVASVADIYNVILAKPRYQKKGVMSLCLKALCSYLLKSHVRAIIVKVLKTNRVALRFYFKNGFRVAYTRKDYYVMRLSLPVFEKIEPVFLKSR